MLGNPGILWKFADVVQGGTSSGTDLTFSSTENIWVFYLEVLNHAVGLPVLLCAAAAMFWSVIERHRETLLLTVFALVFYVALSSAGDPNLVFSRYVLPMLPAIVVLAAWFVVRTIAAMGWPQGRIGRLAGATVVVALLAFPTLRDSVAYDLLLSRKDTRTSAKEWFELHVPARSTVFLWGAPDRPTQLPVGLSNTPENLRALADECATSDPGKAKFLRMRAELIEQGDAPNYDLFTLRVHESWPGWETCKSMGIEYVVLTEAEFNAVHRPNGAVPQSRYDFCRALQSDPMVSLAAEFDPVKLRAPGPHLRVYHIQQHSMKAAASAGAS